MVVFNLNASDQDLKWAVGREFSGKTLDVKSTRMGGKFATIYCGTEYEIQQNGALVFIREWMGCIANKAQYAEFFKATAKNGYIMGRPTARKVAQAVNNGYLTFN